MGDLTATLRRAIGGGASGSARAQTAAVTWEQVEAVTSDGKYQVRGTVIPVAGLKTFKVGDEVPVAWKRGRPFLILGHLWRKAKFGPIFRAGAKGLVEELLVGNFDKTVPDVWYRNFERFDKLEVSEKLLPQQAQRVKWGLDGKSFVAKCTDDYWAIFTLDREDPNISQPTDPGTPTLVRKWKALDTGVVVSAVTFKVDTQYEDKYFICEEEYVWTTVRNPHYGQWSWLYGQDKNEFITNLTSVIGRFGADVDGGGSASGSVGYSFPLKQLLSGGIPDGVGQGRASATVLDWFLDEYLDLQFLIEVNWDYFQMRATNVGGTRVGYSCFSPDGLHYSSELRAINSSFAGGSAAGVLGGKKSQISDYETVPETHLVVFNASQGTIGWRTCAGGNTLGSMGHVFTDSSFMKIITTNAYPEGGPGGQQPGDQASTSFYYVGSNYGYMPDTFRKDLGSFYSGGEPIGNRNGQLLDPGCVLFPGPYSTQGETGMVPRGRTMKNWYYYVWTMMVGSKTFQKQWFYRIAKASLYAARVKRGTDDDPTYVDEPRLMVTVERYPYIGGTNYLNDIPQIGIFLVRPNGTIVQVLRSFSYGLGSGDLLSGNGHRLLWQMAIGVVIGAPNLIHTNLDTGQEATFTPTQLADYAESEAKCYPPDFLWDRASPEAFDKVVDLPTLTPDEDLDEWSKLTAIVAETESDKGARGDVRIINDQEVLTQLGKYQDI